ncbi:outer membrane autotransporter protein [Rhodoblastus acidophilus]|uniref:autotransporter family protein n=1 Tax=Rhodoblastus acidophilus TaxID=1074 RepID=UPI0022247147|nr:autotransporter domain-containing protein [Rhodoblastus acidophilus]MCW2314943.1 outer membrane autotransporter protein [Rhodoblastus acidophilus]
MLRANQVSSLALIVAAGLASSPALAASTTVTAADANVLNLLSPFLSLNATAIGQAALTANLNGTIATNAAAGASPVISATSISDKTIFDANSGSGKPVSISTTANGTQYYGVAANLGGGLPTQTIQNGIAYSGSGVLTSTPVNGTISPAQSYGGLGNLGGAYQTAVSPYAVTASNAAMVTASTAGTANPLLTGPYNTQNVVSLLQSAYAFTSTDLGVAKNYFANGNAANPGSVAVAPAGYTLPTANGLPNTTNSVYDLAYGVNNTQTGQNIYGDSRPVQAAASKINQYDPASINGLTGNPSFPSGHTTYAFTDSILIGMMTPQFFQSMFLRGTEYGNSRIDLGVHYPLDIIASRAFVQYDLTRMLNATASTGASQATNPYYYANANGSTTVLNLNGQFVGAAQSLNGYLSTQTAGCGGTLAACAASNPYNSYSASTYAYQGATNAAIVQYRQTYGVATYSFAQAPRELADTQGNTAAILLSTLYGGQGDAQAQNLANAVTGGTTGAGILANLTTGTINQIIANTETQAIQAFYGSQLSYWTRINLYDAAGYFSGVTGALTLAPTDAVNTNVTVANGGSFGGAGVVTGSLTYQSGAALIANPGATLTVKSGAVTLQNGASVALGAYTPGTYKVVQADSGQTVSLADSVAATGSVLAYEKASLSVANSALAVTLTSNTAAAAQTANQRAVAAAIDAGANASGFAGNALGQSFYTGLTTGADAAATLDRVGGAERAGANFAALQTGATIADAISNQAAFGLLSSGPDTSGISHALSYAGEPKKGPIVVKGPAPAPSRDWRVWGEFLGGGVNVGGDGGRPGFNGATYGGLAGLDYLVQPNWLFGVALGGSTTHYKTSLGGSGDVDAFHGGLYTAYAFGPGYYFEGSETFSANDNKGQRWSGGAALQQLKSSYGSWEARTRLELGRTFAWDAATQVTPFIAGEIAALQSEAYAETLAGGGVSPFALATDAKTTMSTPLFLGAKLSGVWTDWFGVTAHPFLSLAWVHEFSPDRNVTGQLVALPGAGFTVSGPRAASDLAQVKAGLELTNGTPLSVFAKFGGEFAPSVTYYGGQVGVKYAF